MFHKPDTPVTKKLIVELIGAGCTGECNGFKNIGFTATILPDEHIEPTQIQ
jgi:hypothetical protein